MPASIVVGVFVLDIFTTPVLLSDTSCGADFGPPAGEPQATSNVKTKLDVWKRCTSIVCHEHGLIAKPALG